MKYLSNDVTLTPDNITDLDEHFEQCRIDAEVTRALCRIGSFLLISRDCRVDEATKKLSNDDSVLLALFDGMARLANENPIMHEKVQGIIKKAAAKMEITEA